MSEILSAIRLKDKLTIAGAMAAVAALLAILVGIFTFCTADRHKHNYDFSLQMEEDGSFSLAGVCNVDNCEDPFYGETNLQGVELLSAIRPTCAKEGNRVYTYNHNGVTLKLTEVLPKSAHTYEYELVGNGENVHINGMCKVEGCTNPYVFIYDAKDLTLIEVEEATCFSPRKETYAFISGGETKTFVTLVEEDIPHTLNGVPATSYQNPDKTYPEGIKGVKPLGEAVGCGEIGQGYYVCENCRQAVGVNVLRPAHNYTYSESDLKAPTLDASGLATVRCENDGCGSIVEIVLPKAQKGVNAVTKSPATELRREVITYTFRSDLYDFTVRLDFEIGDLLTHRYEYWLEPDTENTDRINLMGKCTQPECQNPDLVVKNVETTYEDTSTCTNKGYWIWTHTLDDGTEVVLKVKSLTFAPHVYESYDLNAADTVKPSEYKDGSLTLGCANQGCSHSTTVVLPKVVIGENATVQQQFTNGVLVNYTFVTDEGFEITFLILLDR